MEFIGAEIDFEHLKRYVGDDADLTAEVFGLFKNQVDMWASSINPDIDDDTWYMMAHSLKGTAKAIGAVNFGKICENAEALIGEGNRPGSRDVIAEKMENAISQIMIEIQRWEYNQVIKKMKSQ